MCLIDTGLNAFTYMLIATNADDEENWTRVILSCMTLEICIGQWDNQYSDYKLT